MDANEISSVNQVERHDPVVLEYHDATAEMGNNDWQLGIIRQPMPPPVQAQLPSELLPACPSRVSDIKPGLLDLPKGIIQYPSLPRASYSSETDGRVFEIGIANTAKNLETCRVLAGSLRNRVYHIPTLIIPKQEGTPDSVLYNLKFQRLPFAEKKKNDYKLPVYHSSVFRKFAPLLLK